MSAAEKLPARRPSQASSDEELIDLRERVRASLRKVAQRGKTCRVDSALHKIKTKMTQQAISVADVEDILAEDDEHANNGNGTYESGAGEAD